MFKIFFLPILLLSIHSFAQTGIKAGFTTNVGYHAGITSTKAMFKNAGITLNAELLFQNKSLTYLIIQDDIENPGNYKWASNHLVMHYIQIPVNIKKTFNGVNGINPYVKLGAAPSLGLSKDAERFFWSALISAGVDIKRFSVEGRYDLGITNKINHKNLMGSIGYQLFKAKKNVNIIE